MNWEITPRPDSLPSDFYRGYEVRQLSVSQRRGIIKLMPKKDADLCFFFLKWRPVNTPKYLPKTTNLFKIVIPEIVNSDQTSFIEGRVIGENITLNESIINYTATQNIPGQLLFLNFEKAFEW